MEPARQPLGDVTPAALLRRVTAPSVRLALADAIAHPAEWAVVLDFDGTVAPFVKRAAKARPGRAAAAHLRRLPMVFSVVAFISGRPAAFVRDAVGSDAIEYVGLYGAERWDAVAGQTAIGPEFMQYIAPLHDFMRTAWTPALATAGVALEDKGAIMTLHWRGAKDPAAAAAAVGGLVRGATAAGWLVTPNEMNVEIRPPIPLTKEDAARRLLSGRRLRGVILVGDEDSDIRAWSGAKSLQDSGGIGHVVRVGVASDHTPAAMAAQADLMVAGVRGVARFLGGLVDAVGAGGVH